MKALPGFLKVRFSNKDCYLCKSDVVLQQFTSFLQYFICLYCKRKIIFLVMYFLLNTKHWRVEAVRNFHVDPTLVCLYFFYLYKIRHVKFSFNHLLSFSRKKLAVCVLNYILLLGITYMFFWRLQDLYL